MHAAIILSTAAAAITTFAWAQEAEEPVADVDSEIVVRSAIPRCLPRPGDPQDLVDVSAAPFRQVMLMPGPGGYSIAEDSSPMLGPDMWQRSGIGIQRYVFRVPSDDKPLCLGAVRGAQFDNYGSLRQIVDAGPYRGKYVQFTGFIAARTAAVGLRLFLVASNHPKRKILQGGDTSTRPIRGSVGWVPVTLTIGPIAEEATQISYGFLLIGHGDIWLDQPRLQVSDTPPREPADAVALGPIGSWRKLQGAERGWVSVR